MNLALAPFSAEEPVLPLLPGPLVPWAVSTLAVLHVEETGERHLLDVRGASLEDARERLRSFAQEIGSELQEIASVDARAELHVLDAESWARADMDVLSVAGVSCYPLGGGWTLVHAPAALGEETLSALADVLRGAGALVHGMREVEA